MFKTGVFYLSAPLCKCADSKKEWGIHHDSTGKHGVFFRCGKCGAQLTVPSSEFLMSVESPSPTKEQKKEQRPTAKKTPDAPPEMGRVIEFAPFLEAKRKTENRPS